MAIRSSGKVPTLMPTFKIFNFDRLIRPIDIDEGQEEAGRQAHYDESDDDEKVDLKQDELPSSSAVLLDRSWVVKSWSIWSLPPPICGGHALIYMVTC